MGEKLYMLHHFILDPIFNFFWQRS